MKAGSDNLKTALTGSFRARFLMDVFYGSTRLLEDVPIVSPDLRWDSEADIKSAGSVQIVYTPEFAESLTPAEFTDALAPFGAEVAISCEISAGGFSERVPQGIYRIKAVPSAYDEHMNFLGQTIVSGSRVQLTLADRALRLQRWGFASPEQPLNTAMAWDEVARITGMQIIRNVPDVLLGRTEPYEATNGGRLKAVQQIMTRLGGRPVFNPLGQLTCLPYAAGPVAAALELGERGTILDVDYSMDSDDVCNQVIGDFETVDRAPVRGTAQITTGRLAVSSQYGVYTHYMTGRTVQNQDEADAICQARLDQLSSQNSYRVPVQCIYNPLIDDGDVVTVERPTKTLVGRVVSHSTGDNGLMNLLLEVARPV